MTIQEALTELKASIEGCGFQCHMETYKIAISALEKQIPKKPLSIQYDNGTINYGCPKCKAKLVSYIDGMFCAGEMFNYCPDCSQELDWSEIWPEKN